MKVEERLRINRRNLSEVVKNVDLHSKVGMVILKEIF